MSLPIELCYLPLPCRRPSLKPGPNQKDPFEVLNNYKPAFCSVVAYTSNDCGDTSTTCPRSSRRTRSHLRANPRLCVTMSEVRR